MIPQALLKQPGAAHEHVLKQAINLFQKRTVHYLETKKSIY